jgi:hypothetical protein
LEADPEKVAWCNREEVEARVEFRDVNRRWWRLTPPGKPKFMPRGWNRVHREQLEFKGLILVAKLDLSGEVDV